MRLGGWSMMRGLQGARSANPRMRTAGAMVLAFILAACSPDPEDNASKRHAGVRAVPAPPDNSVPAAEALPPETASEDAGEHEDAPATRVLDLSLPEGLPLEEWDGDTGLTEPPKLFDADGLFKADEKEKKRLSVIVNPNLKAGEELTDAPEVDGGSVEFKVKTK